MDGRRDIESGDHAATTSQLNSSVRRAAGAGGTRAVPTSCDHGVIKLAPETLEVLAALLDKHTETAAALLKKHKEKEKDEDDRKKVLDHGIALLLALFAGAISVFVAPLGKDFGTSANVHLAVVSFLILFGISWP